MGNASCGMASIFLCLDYAVNPQARYLWAVFVLLPLALFCDILDGFVARRLVRRSLLGADLDSLADIVSFGVAPAVLGYALGLRGLWDALVLVYFVLCGIGRLARFNVTSEALSDGRGKVKYYEGTPIPTSIFLVIILGVAFWLGRIDDRMLLGHYRIGPWILHPLAVLYALSGSAMISSMRIPKP